MGDGDHGYNTSLFVDFIEKAQCADPITPQVGIRPFQTPDGCPVEKPIIFSQPSGSKVVFSSKSVVNKRQLE